MAVSFALGILFLAQHLNKSDVHADKQFSREPVGFRVAHLASDPVAGRKDYIFRGKPVGSGASTITAYAPGGPTFNPS